VLLTRYQRGEPHALAAEAGALIDHPVDERDFAAFTPQFILLPAEVKRRMAIESQIAQFALASLVRIGGRGMERRVTQHGLIQLVFVNYTVKNRVSLFLTSQTNGAVEPRVCCDNGIRRSHCLLIHFAAGKAPLVFTVADQRIDQVSATANIQNVNITRYDAAVIFRQQVSQMMNIVSTPWHRRAEETFRDIPVGNLIKMAQ